MSLLSEWFGSDKIRQVCVQDVERNFYGPDSRFVGNVKKVKQGVLNRESMRDVIDQLTSYESWDRRRFEQLATLAKLYVGEDVAKESLHFLNETSFVDEDADLSLRANEEYRVKRVAKFFAIHDTHFDFSHPTATHWSLLTIAEQWCGERYEYVERTPLFLGDEASGSGEVLWLVTQRMPGPPIVTPDWWRLGLVPLGDNFELLHGIHRGFEQVLNSIGKHFRFQLTWWLMPMTGERWHVGIRSNCDSANLPAACLALAHQLGALETCSFPLLDDHAGCTGRLCPLDVRDNATPVVLEKANKEKASAENKPLADKPVFSVGAVEQKFNVAHRIGTIFTMVVPKANKREANSTDHLSLYAADNLDDAFQMLLSSSAAIQQGKRAMLSVDGRQPGTFVATAEGDRLMREQVTEPALLNAFQQERPEEALERIVPASSDYSFGGTEPFFLGQPVWYADSAEGVDVAVDLARWHLGIAEGDPMPEGHEPIQKTANLDADDPQNTLARWMRVGEMRWTAGESSDQERDRILKIATSSEMKWRRVCLVCRAGLGKTANLRWLEWKINSAQNYRSKNLAVFFQLTEFAQLATREAVKERIIEKLKQKRSLHLELAVERMLLCGRITFLLDSLDQALAAKPLAAVEALCKGDWRKCRVWLTGRPYAFREDKKNLRGLNSETGWQFLRIGPLDEAEACQNIQMLSHSRNS